MSLIEAHDRISPAGNDDSISGVGIPLPPDST